MEYPILFQIKSCAYYSVDLAHLNFLYCMFANYKYNDNLYTRITHDSARVARVCARQFGYSSAI